MGLRFQQINLHHCKEASSVLRCSLDSGQTGVSLIQEPYFYKGAVRGLGNSGRVHCVLSSNRTVRACIFTHKSVNAMLLRQFSSCDFVTVQVRYHVDGRDCIVICCSAYLPYDGVVTPNELTRVTTYCSNRNLNLIVGCDANSHHLVWGSTDINTRGEKLMEFIVSSDLCLLNKGNRPTFINRIREEVIDITLCSPGLEPDVSDWHVSQEHSFSDHQTICFSLAADAVVPTPFRNPKRTNWVSYKEKLNWRLGEWRSVVTNTQDIENEVDNLTNSIMSSYYESCSLRRPVERKKPPWFGSNLDRLKVKCQQAWNQRHVDFEAFKASRKAYKKAIRQAKRNNWKEFCESVEGCAASARMHRILAKDRSDQVSSLKLNNGDFTSDEKSLLNHLLQTHFPGCTEMPSGFAETEEEKPMSSIPMTVLQRAMSICKPENIRWAIKSFSPYKSPGPDGIFPALLQEGIDVIVESLHVIFTACLTLGYVPRKWREVRVTFIPKPGRIDYEEAKNHRGISLSSFLLKTLERLIDRHVRQTCLRRKPLCNNQHAYQRGKSTMSAVQALLSKIESSLKSGDHVVATFLDIEGAFDRSTFDSFERAAKRHDVDPFIIDWIVSMLQKRTLIADIKGISVRRRPVMGCPQGGVLSPLIWLLIADSLLLDLREERIFSIGFADDFVIAACGKFLPVVIERAQAALRIVESYTNSVGLSVNPAKVGSMLFTGSRNPQSVHLRLFGGEIPTVNEFKYLGLNIDSKLNWNSHIEKRTKKACMTLGQCRRAIGKTWGLTPRSAYWLYSAIVLPAFTYGAVAWWRKAQQETVKRKLNHLQRLGLLGVTGAMRTTPTAALECLCGVKPLHILVEEEARAELFRLKTWGHFDPSITPGNISFGELWSRMMDANPLWLAPSDAMIPELLCDRIFHILHPTRDEWVERVHLQADDYTFFTDGSLCSGLSGAGIYSAYPELSIAIKLGQHITVFQAEVLALTECAYYCLQSKFCGSKISICSDSQAALKALQSYKISSRLILECRTLLQELAKTNLVSVVWVPGHSNIDGNENADELAREGSSSEPISTTPCIPLSKRWARSTIVEWGNRSHHRFWMSLDSCQQTKLLCKKPLGKLEAKSLISLRRIVLRKLVGVLTGHYFFNKHLYNMGLTGTTLCNRCEEDEDTAYHLICLCPRLANRRRQILGDFVLSLNQYEKLGIMKINEFISSISLDPLI